MIFRDLSLHFELVTHLHVHYLKSAEYITFISSLSPSLSSSSSSFSAIYDTIIFRRVHILGYMKWNKNGRVLFDKCTLERVGEGNMDFKDKCFKSVPCFHKKTVFTNKHIPSVSLKCRRQMTTGTNRAFKIGQKRTKLHTAVQKFRFHFFFY